MSAATLARDLVVADGHWSYSRDGRSRDDDAASAGGGDRGVAAEPVAIKPRVCLNADKHALPTLFTRPTSFEMTHP